jgi:hypothetical protein
MFLRSSDLALAKGESTGTASAGSEEAEAF